MSKIGLITLAFIVAIAGLVMFGMRGVDGVECEVCITFNGETVCRTGQGRDRGAAIETARTSACAVLTRGRAESIKCGNSEPTSVSCQ